jgi:hypothetical protein
MNCYNHSMANHLIIIPGLSDGDLAFDYIVKPFWPKHDIQYHPFKMDWRDGQPFAPKLKRLLDRIDELTGNGDTVSLPDAVNIRVPFIGHAVSIGLTMMAYRQRIVSRSLNDLV